MWCFFIYLSVHLFDFLFTFSFKSLCACVYSKSACASTCKYVFFFLCVFLYACFLPKYLSVSVSLNMFVFCLFGCYPAPVISFLLLLSVFIWWYYRHHPSFFLSFFHQFIRGSAWVLRYPSVVWVNRLSLSINYFVLFVLQRVICCFCLLFELSLVITTGVDTCLRLSFDFI